MRKLLLSTGLILLSFFVFGQDIQTGSKVINSDNEKVLGFGFLKRIPGLWHGPVSSATPAGNFDNWYVDFRPIGECQVSHFSLLDSNTVNNMSFFIVNFNGELRVAQRTEGCFMDKCCVTYEVMDSVSESTGFYRFSDFVNGKKRAYTEYRFKDDELVMKVYTSKFNKVYPLQLHSTWTAKLGSRKYASEAASVFNYPQPVMLKDFSNAFNNMNESLFFTFDNDPYKSTEQPYVGSVIVNISIDKKLKIKKTDEICLLLTAEPLFEGIKYKEDNLKYIAKYVYLSVGTSTYEIKNLHPGKYYLSSYLDINKDKKHLKGDYMSSDTMNSFTVAKKSKASVNTVIDFVIP
jgi:hypothetical protein